MAATARILLTSSSSVLVGGLACAFTLAAGSDLCNYHKNAEPLLAKKPKELQSQPCQLVF
jgi:hypothetical protein